MNFFHRNAYLALMTLRSQLPALQKLGIVACNSYLGGRGGKIRSSKSFLAKKLEDSLGYMLLFLNKQKHRVWVGIFGTDLLQWTISHLHP